jgi:hypothetical protein
MTPESPTLESQISQWRGFVARRQAMASADIDELESHLRDSIDDLTTAGLSGDEAFLVAVKRIGRVDEISHEFALEHSDRLWKQLVLGDRDADNDGTGATRRRSLTVALLLAVGAGIAVKVPALFGASMMTDPSLLLRNAFVLILPFLAAYFIITRRPPLACTVALVTGVLVAAAVANLYPFGDTADTLWLTVIHSGVALWLLVGLMFAGHAWRTERVRMDFIRFTGEWFVYLVLIALGGGVLAALTLILFSTAGLDASWFVAEWMLPCGAAGAVLVAAWLVEAKQSVIENIAPVLTKIFTPLFTALLLALVVTAVAQSGLFGETVSTFGSNRELLIVFDVVLIVVLALLLYSMSARDPLAKPDWFDRLQLVMVGSAIVVDAVILSAMLVRIGEFGPSANKVASLGINLILLVNLIGAAWLLVRFLRGRTTYATMERWQTSFLPVYFVWATVVAVVFPPMFGFR